MLKQGYRVWTGIVVAALAAVALMAPRTADAQTYPNRTVRLIVPFSAGGAADTLSRIIADALGKQWGQTVVVENRAGGNTIVGTAAALTSAPDGYTLLIAADQNMTINPALSMAAPYDVARDVAPISLIALNPTMLVVNNDLPARNVAEFVALAKQKPKSILFGSSGPGSIQRLAMEQLAQLAGIELVHVPYRGSNETVAGLLGGNVHTTFNGVSNFLQLAEAGKVRVLASSAARRAPQMPDIPAVRESGVAGLEGYETLSWFGIATHAAVPAPIREKIEADLIQAMKKPELEKLLQNRGFELVANSAAEFGALIKSDTAKWRQVVAKGGITAE